MSFLFAIILITNLFCDKVHSHVNHAPHYVVAGVPYQPPPAPQWPATPRPEPITPTETVPKSADPNVLNNLAIALQLLIVSNLLNQPKENSEIISSLATALEKMPVMPNFVPETPKCEKFVSYEPKYAEAYDPIPHAKYVGSFEPNVFRAYDVNTRRPSRSHGALMSPYEAMGSSFSEPFPSVYSPSKSVYVVDKDLFNMPDLY